MKKYRVMGTTTVSVYKEVWADSESEAYEKAYRELSSLTEYCGNGGYDKLIGVEDDNESVAVNGYIEYNNTEMLEDNPYYFECPECGEQCCNKKDAEGDEYWWCDYCSKAFDDDGNETCGIRYTEFISLCIDQIQKLKKRVEELENKLNTTQND
jgi:hypothetical protein